MGRLIASASTLFLLIHICQGQISLDRSVIAAGGAYAENETISLSWTLGELATSTLSGEGLILTQGFQQAMTVGTGLESKEAEWSVSVYPNPVNEELRVRFNIQHSEGFFIEIQDVTGRVIYQTQHMLVQAGDEVILNTSGYSTGIYFLKVLSSDRQHQQVTSLRKL